MFYFLLQAESEQSFGERLSTWYRSSLLCELLQYFRDTYFTVSFPPYRYLSLSENSGSFAQSVIFSFVIAMVLAVILAQWIKTSSGKMVRCLLQEEIHTPEDSKTLFELGCFRSVAVRYELKYGQLRKVVACKEQELLCHSEYEQASEELPKKHENNEFRLDFKTAHFYIPSELKQRAELRYAKPRFGWLPVLLVIILAPILAALLCTFLPDILQFIDNIISMMTPQ